MKYQLNKEISLFHSLFVDDDENFVLQRAWNNHLWLNTIEELTNDVHFYNVSFKYEPNEYRFTRVREVYNFIKAKQRDVKIDIYLFYPPAKDYKVFRTETLRYKRNNQLTLF